MALKPDSTNSDLTVPEHEPDRPEDWGWHGEWGRWTRVGGWVSAIILVLMTTSTHYNGQGTLFLGLTAGGLVVALLIDRQRRKYSWRQ